MSQNSNSNGSQSMHAIVAVHDQIKNFTALIDNISTLDDKKRLLWKEIYTNAVLDRENAQTLLSQLRLIVGALSTEHSIHGVTMTKYIERMSRANDQLLRLAELIAQEETKSMENDIEILYSKISGEK